MEKKSGIKKNITIFDVAKAAGVGIGTVSRVINNQPGVSEKTRRKVLKVIEELGYTPSFLAKGLATKRIETIGVVAYMAAQYFFFEILKGIQEVLKGTERELLLFDLTYESKDKVKKFYRRVVKERRVGGLLILSLPVEEDDEEFFIKNDFPVVVVDRKSDRLDSVFADNYTGIKKAVKHLYTKIIKLKRKALIGFVNGLPGAWSSQEKYRGFVDALMEMDLPFDKSQIVWEEFTYEGGRRGLKALLKRYSKKLDGVIFASDIQCIGALQEIPKNLAFISYDGLEVANFLKLRTVDQRTYEVGMEAVRLLLKRMKGNREDFPTKRTLEPVVLDPLEE